VCILIRCEIQQDIEFRVDEMMMTNTAIEISHSIGYSRSTIGIQEIEHLDIFKFGFSL
jgi:hypothetical protein